MSHALELCDLRIDLAGNTIVQINHAVAPGQITTIMGPSGSGKSTLLSAILGHLDPAFACHGTIHLGDHDITRTALRDRRIGVLFQDDLLFPHLSVGGNLGFALPRTYRGADRQSRIDAALAQAGMAGFAPRDPATLSGGQRARVALIRTLLAEPRALLLDEPFSRLDLDLRATIRAQVFDHIRRSGLPTILVTHDPADAQAAAGPVLSVMGQQIFLPPFTG